MGRSWSCFHFPKRLQGGVAPKPVDCATWLFVWTALQIGQRGWRVQASRWKTFASTNTRGTVSSFFADPDGLPLELYESCAVR